MKTDFQLKLQAYLDGELPEAEAREVAASLTADAEARALQAELTWAKRALAGGELPRAVPETREFYWSKIERELDRLETAGSREQARPALPWWRRMLAPAAGLVALAMLFSLTLGPFVMGGPGHHVETNLEDTGAFTYRDQAEGVTLVWLSYPSERAGGEEEESESFN